MIPKNLFEYKNIIQARILKYKNPEEQIEWINKNAKKFEQAIIAHIVRLKIRRNFDISI